MFTVIELNQEDREVRSLVLEFIELAIESSNFVLAESGECPGHARRLIRLLDLGARIQSRLSSHVDHEERLLHDAFLNSEHRRDIFYGHLKDHASLVRDVDILVRSVEQTQGGPEAARLAAKLVTRLNCHHSQFDMAMGGL